VIESGYGGLSNGVDIAKTGVDADFAGPSYIKVFIHMGHNLSPNSVLTKKLTVPACRSHL
jgi:hypothetical protein